MGDIQHADSERAIEDARTRLLQVHVPRESMATGQALLGIAVGGVFAAVPFVAIQVLLFPDFGLPIGFALGPLSVIAFVRYQENQKHEKWKDEIRRALTRDIKWVYQRHFRRSESPALWDMLYNGSDDA